jgi:hypothetical protein
MSAKMSLFRILAVLSLALLPMAVWSDMIYTQGGRVYEGDIVEQTETTITIQHSTGTVQLPREAVTKIEKQPTRQPTETPTETPQPTITRFPTSTPTDTPLPTVTSTPVPTEAFQPLATPAPVYSATQADELIAKYEKVQIPKEKYVLAYYAKGVQAIEEKKPATAIMRWTDALQVNHPLFDTPHPPPPDPPPEPLIHPRFFFTPPYFFFLPPHFFFFCFFTHYTTFIFFLGLVLYFFYFPLRRWRSCVCWR